MTEQELPSAPENERAFLASVLLQADAIEEGRHLRDDAFTDPHNAALFGVVTDFRRDGTPLDLYAVSKALRERQPFKASSNATVEVAGFIAEVTEATTTAANAKYHADLVTTAWHKRRLLTASEEMGAWARNGKAPRSILNDTFAELEDLRREIYSTGDDIAFTFAQLREKFPELKPPVVEGLIRQGETFNIISVSKIGKSWLGYNLLLCKCAGLPWLGRFEMSPGRVLLIDNELHKPTLAHRIPHVAEVMGLERRDWEPHFDVWSLRGNLCSLRDLEPRINAIEPGEYDLILCDAKYRFATGGESENDNAAETATYNLLDQLAERTQGGWGLIHHSSKGSQSDKRVTDVGAGAGAQSRAADCHLILREHEEGGVVVLEAAVRSFKPVEPLALRWNFPLWVPASGIDPKLLKGRQTRGEERQSQRDSEGTDKIIKALMEWKPDDDGLATARKLRRKTGIGPDRMERLLDWLESEGHVAATETTIKGNACRVYSIKE